MVLIRVGIRTERVLWLLQDRDAIVIVGVRVVMVLSEVQVLFRGCRRVVGLGIVGVVVGVGVYGVIIAVVSHGMAFVGFVVAVRVVDVFHRVLGSRR